MERSLIQNPSPAAAQRPAADFSPAVKDVVQRRAFEARRTRAAIPGLREPGPGINFIRHTQKGTMDPLINPFGLQAAKCSGPWHGEGHRQILPVKNHPAARPSADRRKRPRTCAYIRIPLRVAERDGRSRPAVEADNREARAEKQCLVHGHLLCGSPCLVVLPKLKPGDHLFMAYHRQRRNPLLLLVAGGIECLGEAPLWQSRHSERDSAR